MSDEKKLRTKAIVRPPSPNFSNGLTTIDLGKPIYARAVEQHEAYCEALRRSGLALVSLEADDRSSFVGLRGVSSSLHLKSGLAYLGNNRLVVTEALANCAEFRGHDLVLVSAGEDYAANCLRVNDQVLVAAGYPAFERRLQELGYETMALEMSEFQKMDGGLSCLSLRF